MPYDGEKREVRVQYKCNHCQREGVGFKTETYSRNARGDGSWWSGDKTIPNNWRSFALGVYLCDRCADNPKAQAGAREEQKTKVITFVIGCAVLIVIGLVYAGIEALVN